MSYFKEIIYHGAGRKETETRIVDLDSARRHVIRINGLEAKRQQFSDNTAMRSRELIKTPVNSIALFCSEYVPSHFPDRKYISYIMTVNGVDYQIEPINSHRQGKKIIRYSDLEADQPYAVYLNESIKSAYLTIVIESYGKTETPYLSNIKILYGEGEG